MKREHFAVDLDGTLLEYGGWRGAEHFGRPLPGALNFVTSALRAGHRVTVFTTRTNVSDIRAHMKEHGFPDLPITNVKSPTFTAIIDDRAIRFEDADGWREGLEAFAGWEPWWGSEAERAE